MYLALEGIDTAGKSTQIAALQTRFPEAIFTKEPGGTPVGTAIRSLLLEHGVQSGRAEMLLFLADRSEHTQEVILPNRDRLIVSDRSLISGMAYAMATSAFDLQTLITLNRFATDDILPDHVVILKLTRSELQTRLQAKRHDAIESRGIDYLLAVQDNLETAAQHLEIPTLVLDAASPIDRITTAIETTILSKGAP